MKTPGCAALAGKGKPGLPKLLSGTRRWVFARLLLLAIGCSALGVLIALQVGSLVAGSRVLPTTLALSAMIIALGIGRYRERVLAEKLGQDYVAQIRLALVSHSMLARHTPSVGITVARASNDLSSVRNWVSQGIAPLIAGVPLVVISAIGLWMLHPMLALALIVPVLLLAVALASLSGVAFARSRTLRRYRGKLAARIADTVAAASGVAAAGGTRRELNRVEASSQKVVAHAIHRAKIAAVLRAASLSVPLLATVAVVLYARHAELGPAQIATSLTLLGLCAAPLGEWGRIVEYRQNYRAARRIIAPLLAEENLLTEKPQLESGARRTAAEIQAERYTGVWVRGLDIDGLQIPDLLAEPGARIRLSGADAARRSELMRTLSTARDDNGAILGSLDSRPEAKARSFVVAGRAPGALNDQQRRKLMGAAFAQMVPERGSIIRALRYRRPQEKPERALALAQRLGVDVDLFPAREQTLLRRGGFPLSSSQRAGLLMTRAMLGSPALLLLDGIEAALDPRARIEFLALIENYPGVIIVDSSASWCSEFQDWSLDGKISSSAMTELEGAQ